ncbi:putative kinesin [Dendryphion nanum]|uniref:Kinesin n=1 Tax=Dendryphion nanum TaxID=256645 RepID=A0A9P9DIC8_9PLEO|nr:putative kinesin [Dendryphion nanum]
MAPRHLQATEYTVGWVCALPIELAAAQAILDEKHEGPPHDSFDSNLYTLGRIGSHSVVLICLPAGQMGTNPAAVAATRMLTRFKSIRFGLMVGVGGGVPSAETDIRLGDVVISQPYKQHGGVVQYDFGKTGRDGHMRRTGFLNAPPKVLLSAVSQLQADRHRNQSNLAANLALFDRLPDFSRAAAGLDVLFEASYNHGGEASCEQCNKEKVIQRKARKHEEEVVVHYGTIASGNQVMKDGVTRDRLSAELGGVLCFEMEAAGLMNDFPCLVIRGICDYADSHKNKAWQPYAAATAAACAKEVLSLIPAAEVAETESVGELHKYHIPFSLKSVPVGKFADRLRDTQALERELLPQRHASRRRTMVVHGLGGMGKTQLAADFARRHRDSFSAVLWLDGSSESSIKQSLAACASRIPQGQVPEASRKYAAGQGGDVDAAVKDVLDWLAIPDNSEWLLVVDNIDRDDRRREEDAEAYDVEHYLPGADHGAVLITTRLPHLKQLGAQREARKVDSDHARAIFEAWYGKPVGQEGDELLALLDGLPLALAQAAAYMGENGTGFETYTRLYKEQWRALMEGQDSRKAPLRNYTNGSVATTWMISFAAVRSRSEAAANLLLLWAHLDNRSMWYGLLAAASQKSAIAAEQTLIWLGEIVQKEIEFIKAIAVLRSYSLVEDMEDQTGYATHPVVHQWALHIQDEKQRAGLSWVAVIVVGLAVPTSDTEKYWETQARLFPHAGACEVTIKSGIGDIFEEQKEVDVLLWAMHGLGILYAYQGKLDKAEEMYQRALRGKEKAWGPEHTSTLDTVYNLGLLYVDLGKLDKAEEMYQRALRGYEKAWGPEHTSTLDTVNNLGNLYADLGRMDEAEKMLLRALQGKEKAWGPEHTSTLSTVNNLGNLYADLGRMDEAEKMLLRALQGKEKAWGPEHTSTLSTVNNLGNLYINLGRMDEAEKMLLRALQGKEKAWGPEHTSTLSTVNNLGSLYADLGRMDEAEKMLLRALQGMKKAWGPEHTSTLSTVNNLGSLYKNLGRMDEAEKMLLRALQGYEKVVGVDRISSYMPALNTMRGFATLCELQGRVKDAKAWYFKALSGYQKILGNNHRKCCSLRDNLTALSGANDDITTAGKNVPTVDHTRAKTNIDRFEEPVKPSSKRDKVWAVTMC